MKTKQNETITLYCHIPYVRMYVRRFSWHKHQYMSIASTMNLGHHTEEPRNIPSPFSSPHPHPLTILHHPLTTPHHTLTIPHHPLNPTPHISHHPAPHHTTTSPSSALWQAPPQWVHSDLSLDELLPQLTIRNGRVPLLANKLSLAQRFRIQERENIPG